MIIRNILPLIVLSAFAMVVSLGLGMSMTMDGSMACPWMSHHGSICPMGMLQHMALWQEAFNAILTSSIAVFLSLLTLVFFHRTSGPPPEDGYWPYYFACKRRNSVLKCSDYMTLSFSRGILNPKLH